MYSFSQLHKFLKQPYPFYFQGTSLWILSGLLFAMSLGFNYLFEPFIVNPTEHKMDFFWISCVHALMPVLVLLVLAFIIKKPNIEETWTIKKESLFIGVLLLLIGISQFLIRDIIYDNPNNWSFGYFFEEIRNTFLIGSLFILVLVPLNFMRLNAKHIKRAKLLNTSHDAFDPLKKSRIVINTNLKSDDFQLDVNNLLFAKAEGNYVEFYIKENSINRIIKRMTIKELEATLSPFDNIIKTHRSYLVNLYYIKNVTGNAQGYKLELDNYNESVPVSRNLIDQFNKQMKHM